jgi:hypothetical protein
MLIDLSIKVVSKFKKRTAGIDPAKMLFRISRVGRSNGSYKIVADPEELLIPGRKVLVNFSTVVFSMTSLEKSKLQFITLAIFSPS